jgi:hypothetical protein
MTIRGLLIVLACIALPGIAAAAPHLYSEPAHQSPVRGAPDDLLLLAGYGLAADDVVVYAAVTGAGKAAPPNATPKSNTDRTGIAPVVSTASVPYSLTIRLPQEMQRGQTYALWVRDAAGMWSNAVLINDARPLWLTPAYVYATEPLASLPRELKVVGRNLEPAPGAVTKVRLSGPAVLILDAMASRDAESTLDHVAARVSLPPRLAPGTYSVQVTRDGVSWVELLGQTLSVQPNPAQPKAFRVSAHGCAPNDDADDTACIVQAIAAARAAGGGDVLFAAGTWNLANMSAAGVSPDGVLLSPGVNLRGAGANLTRLMRASGWDRSGFTLQGSNRVTGFTFSDARIYKPADWMKPMLQLGRTYYWVQPNEARVTADVTISHNTFDKPFIAIADGGLPIERLFVTYNEFGAYNTALFPGGSGGNTADHFRIADSIIAYNTFKPGSYMDTAIVQGTIATQLGAGLRLDFSNNTADGSSTDYLYAPATDARGWRAAFFWHMNGNHEMMLVANNVATCTGDKDGDGEAFSYDNNNNAFAFAHAMTVVQATANTVTVRGTLEPPPKTGVTPAGYYVGHWVQVGQGPGVGQSRKIRSYRVDVSRITFAVEPAWDVTPDAATSRITVGRQFWQVYTVDNRIDQRKPLCLKSNRTRPKGGVIALWAQTSDSLVSGNRQYESDGILFYQSYSAKDAACRDCTAWTMQQSFVEIRANTIDGEYDWSSDCSLSGISAWNSAAPTPGSPPVVAGYGVSISHNFIRHADGLRGGAITVPLGWHNGPAPHQWTVVDNLLIHHNKLVDINGPPPSRKCDVPQKTRVGINLHQADLVWGTVSYANSCINVTQPTYDSAHDTRLLCAPGMQESCECLTSRPRPPRNVSTEK